MNVGNSGGSASTGKSVNIGASVLLGFQNGGVYGAIGSTIGGVFDSFPTPRAELNENNLLAANIRGAASDALLSGAAGPWGMAAGAAIKIMDKTGGFSDASKGLGSTNDTLNTIAAIALPGAGWFTKPLEDYKISSEMKAMAGGYASTMKDNQEAALNAGAKILFGRNLATSKIHVAKINDRMISNIKQNSDNDYETMATMTQAKAIEAQNAYKGGYNQALARAAKFGMKFQSAKEVARRLQELKKPIEEVYEFKDGGKFDFSMPEDIFTPTTHAQNVEFFKSLTFENVPEFKEGGLLNVIPEGALHARKHHMEGTENLTLKGIPVVDNDGNQLAEIEVNEIIFNKEVSEKLEELYKKYNQTESQKEKEELSIEAGKLLSTEIMEHTEDRTGLIQTIE